MATAQQREGGVSIRQRRSTAGSPTNSVLSSSESSEEEKIHANAPPQQATKDKSIVDKLFSSKEEKDSFIPHIHKILGFSCLGSFAYRMFHLGQADCNFGPNAGTLFFVIHHWLLSASSFIFVIPQRRILDGGYRIWPEYRNHALVFASRNLAFILLRWYEQNNPSMPHMWYMDTMIVVATCAFADLGSYLQKEYHSNTVRGATFSDPFEQYFASFMQISLTAFCLVGYGRYTLHLMALFTIQVNAFLMTLRRKNVAPQLVLTGIYTFMLVLVIAAVGLDDLNIDQLLVAATFAGVAAVLRLGPLHLNKYVLWVGLSLAWWYVRTKTDLSLYNNWFWFCGTFSSTILSSLLAWHKRSKHPLESRSSAVGYTFFALHVILFIHHYVINFV